VLITAVLLAPAAATCIVLWVAWLRLRRRMRFAGRKKSVLERRWIFLPCAVLAGGTLLALVYARFVEPRWVDVTRLELRVTRPIGGKARFKIVHLSDLHLERLGGLERRVLEIVREERPDLILLTGDYLNERGAQAELVAFLSALEAPHGVYGVAGNWDGKFPIADLFENAKVRLLRDDYESVADGSLLLVGLDYIPHRTARELTRGASPGSYKILLHHSPEAVDALGGAPFDLFLCGHTHGGQVRLPLLGPLVPTHRYDAGRYFITPPATGNPGGTGMYVNRGIGCLGTGPRVRFFCRPEVVVIELAAP